MHLKSKIGVCSIKGHYSVVSGRENNMAKGICQSPLLASSFENMFALGSNLGLCLTHIWGSCSMFSLSGFEI